MTESEHGQFPSSGGSPKVENDPWVPLEVETSASGMADDKDKINSVGTRLSEPQNPLYQLIDSEKYIQSLEQKLAKLTKNRKRQKEPTSRDIINSLAVFHEDQMRRYLDDSAEVSNGSVVDDGSMQTSYLHRRIYPERQPLNPEEIAELLKEDVMAERFEKLTVDEINMCVNSEQALNGRASDISSGEPEANKSSHAPHKSDVDSHDHASDDQVSGTVPYSNDGDASSETENWANFANMNEERDL